jgi:diguanylate cyclase (GGDEF)-like protein
MDSSKVNDALNFIDEPPDFDNGSKDGNSVWKILVVDDDEDVHITSEQALKNVELLGRFPQFLHAYSANECANLLSIERDVAVILLDVVMETHDAGLHVVDKIRRELLLTMPRIILRTGQPGYAPELDAIRDYDINDYKTKSELTRNKLFTTVLAAIRSYDQIMRMDSNRRGLEKIVQASNELITETSLQSFASGVIKHLAAILHIVPDGLVCTQVDMVSELPSKHYTVIAASGRFESLVQRNLDEIDDSKICESLRRCLKEQEHIFEKEYLVLHFPMRNHKHFAVYIKTKHPPSNDDRELLKVFCSNISVCADIIILIARLKDSAYFDKLVGLPNRTAFIQSINQCFTDRSSDEFNVILIDIDQFTELNNAFGHDYGDRLLIEFANRLNKEFGGMCMISRISGGAFGMLGHEEIIQPKKLRPIFECPFHIDGMEHTVAVSTGTVRLRDSVADGQVVLKDASIARKLAREFGINSDALFTPDIGFKAKERTHLLQNLQSAFDHERLFPVFQPQVELKSGRLLGFEALMRWRTETGEFIPPNLFIPLAEQSGLIVGMGTWILRSSLHFLSLVEKAGWKDLRMSVNVSAVQFRMPDFLIVLQKALNDMRLGSGKLELEITESVAMMGMQAVKQTLEKIRNIGIEVAVDDFGTGFSSLSYLDNLPLDRIKIDQSFIHAMSNELEGSHIPEIVIQLGQSLGLRVIAEGVENEAQAKRLLELGCDEAQGYFYGRPMPAEELMEWLKNRKTD